MSTKNVLAHLSLKIIFPKQAEKSSLIYSFLHILISSFNKKVDIIVLFAIIMYMRNEGISQRNFYS